MSVTVAEHVHILLVSILSAVVKGNRVTISSMAGSLARVDEEDRGP